GELTKRAVDSAVRADDKEAWAIWQGMAAQREDAYGIGTEARPLAAKALKLAPASQGAEVEAALAFALADDAARAESLAQDLGKRFPLDTQMQSLWLPAIQAQLALNHNNPSSEDSRSQRYCLELLDRSVGASAQGACQRFAVENLAGRGSRCRPRPRARYLQTLSRSLERRRPRHPHPIRKP